MDVESPSLAKLPSTEASKFWIFLLTLGNVDCRLLRTSNLPLCPHGWGDTNTSNQNWPVIPGGPCSNVAIAWGSTVPTCPDYMPRSPYSLCIAALSVWDEFRRLRRHELDNKRSRSRNPIANPRFNRCGDDREGPVPQFFFKSPLLVSTTFIFFLSLVWVSTFGLLAGSPFASFAFADFDS